MSKSLLIALLAIPLCSCSKTGSIVLLPPPPANLSQNCPSLPAPPRPLIDPDRLQWEADVVDAYADCAIRHRKTIEAWTKASQTKN